MKLDGILKRCCICSDDFITTDEIIKYPCECKYIHHKSCLLEWLGYPDSGCPICRKPFFTLPLQEGIFTEGVNEITLTELDFVPTVSAISYLSSEDDLDSSDDWVDEDGEYPSFEGNPIASPLQLTPDNPLSTQQNHDFSITFEHTFSIPLYVSQNVLPIHLPQTPPTLQITPISVIPPTLPQQPSPISPIFPLNPVQPSTASVSLPTIISTQEQNVEIETQENTPITLQLFNQHFGLNLNEHIH